MIAWVKPSGIKVESSKAHLTIVSTRGLASEQIIDKNTPFPTTKFNIIGTQKGI